MEKTTIATCSDGQMKIELEKSLFEKQAVFAAAYKFRNQCSIKIEPTDERHVGVFFESEKVDHTELTEIIKKFQNEVLDQQHRRNLNKEFGRLREIIVEHAFSPVANLEDKLNEKG